MFAWALSLVAITSKGQDCSQVYSFNITDKLSYTTSCGQLEESDWKVVQNSCNFYSPVLAAGGQQGQVKQVVINLRLGNSGNLDEKDFAWIFYYVNGKVESTKTIRGDQAGNPVVFRDSVTIPAGSTFKMRLAIVCDEGDEYWRLGNGDLTVCIRANQGDKTVSGEQIDGKITLIREREIVKLVWSSPSGPDGNYFRIERSRNGSSYEFAGYVKDNRGNQAFSRYSFIDSGCFKPETWYRITRIDMRGNSVPFGKPVSVKVQ